MVNRRLLTIILGTSLSASFASVSAADMRNHDDSNIKRGHFQDHANVVRKRPSHYYRESGFRYRDRHFNSSRRFRTHHRFLRHNRGHDGFLLGFCWVSDLDAIIIVALVMIATDITALVLERDISTSMIGAVDIGIDQG